MGDRGQIGIHVDGECEIYLYSHWGGSCLRETLATALHIGRSRWDDPEYLTRIIFCHMVPKEELHGTTGFGIGTILHGDLNNDVLMVNVPQKQVQTMDPITEALVRRESFEDFIKANLVKIT